MTALRALMRRNAVLAMALLVLALLVRAAVPQGWMPEGERGTISVELCASGQTMEIPLDRKDAPSPDHERGQQPCAFGALASTSAPPEAFASLPLPAPVAEQYAATNAAFAIGQTTRQVPPARGPPILA